MDLNGDYKWEFVMGILNRYSSSGFIMGILNGYFE